MDIKSTMTTTYEEIQNVTTTADENTDNKELIFSEMPTLKIVQELCQALDDEKISYCHWKSNNALDRSASGENDLDLLVSRKDVTRFSAQLYQLGFKRALAPKEKQIPGVLNYYGYDKEADKIIHVHAHYQLMLGHDMTKNYRIPIETNYLDSAMQGYVFKVPEPEYEFIIFIIRMIMKHSTWDAIVGREGKFKTVEVEEFTYLLEQVDMDRVYDILNQDMPYISAELFNNCLHVMQSETNVLNRIKTGHQLQTNLQSFARRNLTSNFLLKIGRRLILSIRRRVFKSTSKFRLENGGAMIAIIGGDGAGKSTAVDGICAWLSKDFEISRDHMGKPSWSWLTICVRGILKVGSTLGLYPSASAYVETLDQSSLISPKYPWLLREVCTARDRYLVYRKARRIAANGGLVILDRFPHPQIKLMDGPQARRVFRSGQTNQFAKALIDLEESYYQKMVNPDVIIILRVDPDIAVQRKTEEKPSYVRERSMEIWGLDWNYKNNHIIETSKSRTEVMTELKALLWAEL